LVKLSEQEYRLQLGISPEVLDIPKSLVDMIEGSMGRSSADQVVEVSGTVETQDLHLVVRPKVFVEMI